MASTTIQEQVNAIVSRETVESKVEGVPSPDVEAAAIFEAVGMNLLLKPKTVLFAANLARNGVIAAAKKELAEVANLLGLVQDSTNQTFEIKSTTSLERAKTSLLQIESLAKVDPSTASFKSYNSAVDEFLNQQLAKNVKKKGSTTLTRTGKEAAQDIPPTFASLSSLHATLIDKLYALSVGVDNFITSPMGTVLGVSAAYRARKDLQGIIDSVASDVSGAQSRDYATRLIATRAALKVLGAPPDILGPVLDSAAGKPTGYNLLATTGFAPAVATSAVGPFTTTGGNLVVTVNSSTTSVSSFTLLPARNDAAIYSAPLSFPIVIPANYDLFIHVETTPAVTGAVWIGPDANGFYTNAVYGGGWSKQTNYERTLRAPIGAMTIPDMTALLTALNSAMSPVNADAGMVISFGTAAAFNGNRVVIFVANSFETVGVAANYATPTATPTFFSSSAHGLFGFQVGQSGTQSSIPAQIVADALNNSFSALVTTARNQDETVTISSVATVPGTTMALSGLLATDLGLPASTIPTSSTVSLNGTVQGTQFSPFNPASLVQVGDYVTLPTGSSQVATVTNSAIILETPVPTFADGNVVVVSSLVRMWEVLGVVVDASTATVLNSKFQDGLGSIDLAVAALSGDPTEGKKIAVTALLVQLQTLLQGVVTALSDPSTMLPTGAASMERDNCSNIVSMLVQRKFDKAADYFLQCRVYELFEMDFMTASYGGSLMKAASDFARTDIKFPDRTKDEDTQVLVQDNRSLL